MTRRRQADAETIERAILAHLSVTYGISLPEICTVARLGAFGVPRAKVYSACRAALQRLRRKGLADVGHGTMGYSWHATEAGAKLVGEVNA